MAEQAASAVASAVIGGVTDRALATVMRKLRSRLGDRAAAHEKLQRLETLVLKLRCAVEVSERHAIGSASLLEWRDRLREAAAEGGAVVLDFQRRAREEEEDGGEAAATSASAGAPGQQQPAAATAGALYFTRSALCGMAQRVRDATRRLFSADEDTQKLDSALEKMERLSPDITQFLMALQLEVTPELGQRPGKRKAVATDEIVRPRKSARLPSSPRNQTRRYSEWIFYEVENQRPRKAVAASEITQLFESSHNHRVTLWDSEQRPRKAAAASEITQLASAAEAPVDPETEAGMLARVLEPTLRRMESCYMKEKKTDGTDMEGSEWLAEWAAVIRETVERGNAVLQTLRPGSGVIHNARGGGALEEDGELYSFARAVERLAQEDETFFAALVDLCVGGCGQPGGFRRLLVDDLVQAAFGCGDFNGRWP